MEVFNGGGDDDFWDFADNFSVDEEPPPLLGREVTRDQADEIPSEVFFDPDCFLCGTRRVLPLPLCAMIAATALVHLQRTQVGL